MNEDDHLTRELHSAGRVEWVDCAKGLGILLVIFGHGIYGNPPEEVLRAMLYSFHMPLFFILSGVTYRCSRSPEEFCNKTIKAVKRLLLPALGCFAVYLIENVRHIPGLITNPQFWSGSLYTLIFSSATYSTFLDKNVAPLGTPWFFFVLFSGRAIFDAVRLHYSERQAVILAWVFSLSGVIAGTVGRMPFSLDIALAVQPFFCLGNSIRKGDQAKMFSWKNLLLSALLWQLLLWITWPDRSVWSYMELADRRYPLYPLCMLGAACGSLLLCGLCKHISDHFFKLTTPLRYVGKNSLYLLVIHSVDYVWSPHLPLEDNLFLKSLRLIVVDLLILVLFLAGKRLFVRVRTLHASAS